MKNNLDLSIIIPVYNAARTLEACLNSLMNLDYEQTKMEIVVVDNGSTDCSVELAKKYPINLVKCEIKGRSFARNFGITNSKGSLLAFTDADCVVSQAWLTNLESKMSNSNIGACGGPLLAAEPKTNVEHYIKFRKILDQETMLQDRPCSPPFCVTANLMVHRDVFEKIGFFREDLKAGEDADLCWRMRAAGFQLAYEPKAVVWHHHRHDLHGLISQVFLYGRGTADLFNIYHEKFGKKFWIDREPYLNIYFSTLDILKNIFIAKDTFELIIPFLDLLTSSAFVYGKIYGSILNKRIAI